MIGLIICALIYVLKSVLSDVTPESGLLTCARFAWWWYLVWGCLIGIIPLLMFIGGILGMMAGKTGHEKLGAFGVAAASPLVTLFVAIHTAPWMIAAWCIIHAPPTESAPFSEWNTNKLVMASIMVGVCLFMRISGGGVKLNIKSD